MPSMMRPRPCPSLARARTAGAKACRPSSCSTRGIRQAHTCCTVCLHLHRTSYPWHPIYEKFSWPRSTTEKAENSFCFGPLRCDDARKNVCCSFFLFFFFSFFFFILSFLRPLWLYINKQMSRSLSFSICVARQSVPVMFTGVYGDFLK